MKKDRQEETMELFGVITIGSMVALFIICLILYSRIQKKRHFLCPRCGARFKVPGSRSFFASRQGTDRLLTCPNCGVSMYMENVRDEDYTQVMRQADIAQMKKETDDEERSDVD
jgi:transcription elongation factor Elf1